MNDFRYRFDGHGIHGRDDIPVRFEAEQAGITPDQDGIYISIRGEYAYLTADDAETARDALCDRYGLPARSEVRYGSPAPVKDIDAFLGWGSPEARDADLEHGLPVGQRVVVKDDGSKVGCRHYLKIGSVATVDSRDYAPGKVRLSGESGTHGRRIGQIVPRSSVTPIKFAPGDRVRVQHGAGLYLGVVVAPKHGRIVPSTVFARLDDLPSLDIGEGAGVGAWSPSLVEHSSAPHPVPYREPAFGVGDRVQVTSTPYGGPRLQPGATGTIVRTDRRASVPMYGVEIDGYRAPYPASGGWTFSERCLAAYEDPEPVSLDVGTRVYVTSPTNGLRSASRGRVVAVDGDRRVIEDDGTNYPAYRFHERGRVSVLAGYLTVAGDYIQPKDLGYLTEPHTVLDGEGDVWALNPETGGPEDGLYYLPESPYFESPEEASTTLAEIEEQYGIDGAPRVFEPGDRVRLTGPHYIADSLSSSVTYDEAPADGRAEVLRMTHTFGENASVTVRWLANNRTSVVATSSLSPDTSLYVGDRVRVLANHDDHPAGKHHFMLGDVVEVTAPESGGTVVLRGYCPTFGVTTLQVVQARDVVRV